MKPGFLSMESQRESQQQPQQPQQPQQQPQQQQQQQKRETRDVQKEYYRGLQNARQQVIDELCQIPADWMEDKIHTELHIVRHGRPNTAWVLPLNRLYEGSMYNGTEFEDEFNCKGIKYSRKQLYKDPAVQGKVVSYYRSTAPNLYVTIFTARSGLPMFKAGLR
jgi:hypothetical protein